MYGRRVPKSHRQLEACGAVDELNAALGLARALAGHRFVQETVVATQKELVGLMGELATPREEIERYVRDGFPGYQPAMLQRLDALVAQLEAEGVSFKGWATPGACPGAAAMDVARTVCRRAERRICEVHQAGELPRPELLVYFNRLSDVLWLLARWIESQDTA